MPYLSDAFGKDAGALGRFVHIPRDVDRGHALLLDGGGDRRADMIDLGDGIADGADRGDRVLRGPLDRGDLGGDLLGRLRGLLRERLHLAGDDREAFAGFSRAGRLDGCVQREKIGLGGDAFDDGDDLADLAGACCEPCTIWSVRLAPSTALAAMVEDWAT